MYSVGGAVRSNAWLTGGGSKLKIVVSEVRPMRTSSTGTATDLPFEFCFRVYHCFACKSVLLLESMRIKIPKRLQMPARTLKRRMITQQPAEQNEEDEVDKEVDNAANNSEVKTNYPRSEQADKNRYKRA
jgi:hypothetical protein